MLRKMLYCIAFCSSISGCGLLAPAPEPAAPRAALSPERAEALMQALLALGVDYHYGGNSPATGFDCSGLVAHVYRQAWGIQLPRTSAAQSRVGVPVGLSELQAGDLVFYDTLHQPFSHVGIYLGDGKFVHAPRTGARVRIESLQGEYWTKRFNGARRIQPET